MFVHTIQSVGGAISDTMPALTSQRVFRGFTLHASAAPTTADVFTVTLDSVHGAAFDVVLYSLTLSTGSTVNIVKTDYDLPLGVGDSLRTAFTNTDVGTFGIQLIME